MMKSKKDNLDISYETLWVVLTSIALVDLHAIFVENNIAYWLSVHSLFLIIAIGVIIRTRKHDVVEPKQRLNMYL